VAEARAWRRRHGGTLNGLWPNAAAGLVGLRMRLPRMPDYVAHARAIATELSQMDGVQVVPDPPQTPMMHLYLRTTPSAVVAGVRRMATEQRLWTWGGSMPTEVPRPSAARAHRRRRDAPAHPRRSGRRRPRPPAGL